MALDRPKSGYRAAVDRPALSAISTMSNPTAGQGSLISQHLRATKKLLTDVIFDAECVLNVKVCRIGELTFKLAGSWLP